MNHFNPQSGSSPRGGRRIGIPVSGRCVMVTSAKTLLMCLVLVMCLAVSPAAQADAVWGTGLAYDATPAGYPGYWHYCYHIYWDTTEYGGLGLSHSTIYLALAGCECACDEGYFIELHPAGLAYGEDNCEVDMYPEFDCGGDPHFPTEGPTLKFEPDESLCELGEFGWMHVCYFSLFPPTGHQIFTDHLGIKFSTNVEVGDLEGVLPYCECDVNPVEQSAWGSIKALYR